MLTGTAPTTSADHEGDPMTHDALRPGGESPPDLGFFAGPSAGPVPVPVAGAPFGADVPFGSAARTTELTPAPESSPITTRTLLLSGLVVVALLAVIGVIAVRAWQQSGTSPRTTVSTPAVVGSLSRTTHDAPDLAPLQADLATAVRLRTPRLATYTSGAVTAQVLVARPVAPMLAATQSQVLTAITTGLERITGVPPQLAPVMAGMAMLSPFGCSQVEIGAATPVFCAGASSGAVTLVLVSGQDYASATRTAADLRAGVEHRG
jgi:hypothetical protein